jgi:RNA polymerase-interacting CarD/CdnL/TRCF family regulator
MPHLAAAERACVAGSEVVYPFEGVGTLANS